jgi:hypothetical protein
MKKFRLKKDALEAKKGLIVIDQEGEFYLNEDKNICYKKETVEDNPEWFEEIPNWKKGDFVIEDGSDMQYMVLIESLVDGGFIGTGFEDGNFFEHKEGEFTNDIGDKSRIATKEEILKFLTKIAHLKGIVNNARYKIIDKIFLTKEPFYLDGNNFLKDQNEYFLHGRDYSDWIEILPKENKITKSLNDDEKELLAYHSFLMTNILNELKEINKRISNTKE